MIIMTTSLILHIKRLKATPVLGTLLHGQKKHRSPKHGHLHQRSDVPQTDACLIICVVKHASQTKETRVSLASEMCQVLPSIAVDHQGTVFTLCEGNEQRHPCIASIIVHGKILLSSGQAKKGHLSRICFQRRSFLTSFLYPKAFPHCSGSLLVTESSFVLQRTLKELT